MAVTLYSLIFTNFHCPHVRYSRPIPRNKSSHVTVEKVSCLLFLCGDADNFWYGYLKLKGACINSTLKYAEFVNNIN